MNPGRTFALDMGSDGAASLQKVILDKLTEFMGDYTDDVLAQYILVLVAHGKQQAQATKDLEAFLGDQSETFVAWLWNYLCSNLHLHASVSKASVINDDGMEQKVEINNNGIVKCAQADAQLSLSSTVPSSKHKHGEKLRNDSSIAIVLPDLNGPPPKIGNSDYGIENDKLEANERNAGRHSKHTFKRQQSPVKTLIPKDRKKASDVKHHRKRHRSPIGVNATRRLLQSAVREAVAPIAHLTKSGSKRLRSVVSTELDNSVTLEDANKQWAYKDVDDVRQGRAAAAVVLEGTKAGATAMQNAVMGRGSLVGSVWDRLGRTTRDMKEEGFDGERDFCSSQMVERRLLCANSHLDDRGVNNTGLLGYQSRLNLNGFNEYAAEETISEGLLNAHRGDHYQADVRNEARLSDPTHTQHGRLNDNQEVPVRAKYRQVKSVATGIKEAQKAASTSASSLQFDVSQKHVVCSQGQEPGTSQSELLQTQAARVEGDSQKYVLEMKKRLDHVQREMMKLRAKQSEAKRESLAVSSSTLPGAEQVQKIQDSVHKRTVFVTNIHFAATKESVAAHFAQCGKVEQVVMLMEGATGKPKGSAYVEYSMPIEAEKALALNETSFYSRILKVVLTDMSMIQEMHSNQLTSIRHPNQLPLIPATRSQVFRGSFNAVPGFSSLRGAYATPTKMQWKRDSAATGGSTSVANGSKAGITVPVRTIVKSFTYVRNTVKEGMAEAQKGAT